MADRGFEKRWEHFRDLVEHMFREPGRGSHEADVVWHPATDVYETEDQFVVRMDLSGVLREEVQIHLSGRILHVRGIRRDSSPQGQKRTFHMMEIALGPFARSIQVPDRFTRSETTASYQDGILEIRLTAKPDSDPLDIEIEVAAELDRPHD